MSHVTFTVAPLMPAWAIALVTLGLLAVLAHGSRVLARRQVPRAWIRLLAGIRVAVVMVFALCLLQPVISYRTATRRLPEMGVLIDTSRSMACIDGPGGASRLQAAQDLLRAGGLADAVAGRHRLRYFAFDRGLRLLHDGELGTLMPTGETTRLADSLVTAAGAAGQPGPTTAEERGRAAPRLLVISDGVDLGGTDPADAARRLGVTVDTLLVGGAVTAPAEPRVVITSVQAPRRVLLGAEAEFAVTLRREGDDARPWLLTLDAEGRTLAARDVVFPAGERHTTIRLEQRPDETGIRDYEVRLVPKATGAGPAEGEPYRISVLVVDRKHEVLVLEDTWRWEFKFLRRIFEDDPSFSLTAMVSRPGGSVVQIGEAERRVSLAGMPTSRAELDWFDLYVLGDVRPDRWPRGMVSALAALVRDEGKSLVVVAGPNIAAIAAIPELAALLPVEVTRDSGTPLEGPVEVRVAREGVSTPFFANPPAVVGQAAAVDGAAVGAGGLPTLDQIYPPLRKRPAATVLVEASKRANASGPLIVMAEHTVGRGRVLFIGTDTLWKWHMIAGADTAGVTPFMIFWQQALRAMAPARTFPAGVALHVTPDRTRCEAGRRVVIRADVKSDRPLVAPQIRGSVLAPSAQVRFAANTSDTDAALPPPPAPEPAAGESLPLVFTPDPVQPDSFVAAFEPAESGQHRIVVAVVAAGQIAAEVVTAIDVEPPRVESDQSPADADTLARLAAGTGGRVIDPADPRTFAISDDTSATFVEHAASIDLWNNYVLMLLLCLLLGADWVIRLLKGFV